MFLLIPAVLPVGMVKILASTRHVGSHRLQMAIGERRDPDVLPGRWNHQGIDALSDSLVGHRRTIGIQIGPAFASAPAGDPGLAGVGTPQSRHRRPTRTAAPSVIYREYPPPGSPKPRGEMSNRLRLYAGEPAFPRLTRHSWAYLVCTRRRCAPPLLAAAQPQTSRLRGTTRLHRRACGLGSKGSEPPGAQSSHQPQGRLMPPLRGAPGDAEPGCGFTGWNPRGVPGRRFGGW